MQNVATGKSELAALPLIFNSDSSAVIEDSSQFRSLLHDASEKKFTQPVEPKMPNAVSENELSETGPEQTEVQASVELSDVGSVQAETDQSASDSLGQQSESSDQTETIENQNRSKQLPVSADKNSDLVAELEGVIPAIELLDLLQQSQFTEITISQSKKAVDEGHSKDIKGLVEHLKTLTEQGGASEDADAQAMNTVLNKLITALQEQKVESESPVVLTELLSRIQSDVALETSTEILPAASDDEYVELDIELLSIVIAGDDSPAETPNVVAGLVAETPNVVAGLVAETPNIVAGLVAETPNVVAGLVAETPNIVAGLPAETSNIVEELLAETQQELVEPLKQTKNIVVEADSSENTLDEGLVRSLVESEAVTVVDEIENLKVLQPINDALIEELDVAIQPDETKVSNPSVESKDIRQLLALSPEKLDKALDNLTNRLENQTKIPSSIKQDFIASLKTSIDEIKSQLKQGKQIDTDLKSLVVDNLNRISQEVNPESVGATISRFSQTLELSASLIAHTSANSASGLETPNSNGAVDRVLTKENQSQSNLLQVKQAKQQVVQFEKAVNIMRSEGHQQLVEKVRWMVNQNNLQADIRLDPPDLGAMKVRVSLSGETASVNIAVQSQQAKDLLDSAAPRLRELLQEQGIQLGQSSVEQEQRQKDQNDSAVAGGNSELASETESEEGNLVTEQAIVNGHLSGIDYFV